MAQQKTDATADKLSADVKALREQIEKLSEGQREITLLRYEVTGQDKRLSDTINRIGDVNTWLTGFGILVTMLIFGAGFLSLVQAGRKATKEAREWIRQNEQDLRQQIADLERQVADAKASIHGHARDVADVAEKSKADIEREAKEHSRRLENILERRPNRDKPLGPEDQKELRMAADQAREKPESQYTARDWAIRGHNAYVYGQWDKAALFWGNILEMPNATSAQIAQALFNKGIALGEMQRLDDEIALYDEIENRFHSSRSKKVREYVASALGNRGWVRYMAGDDSALLVDTEKALKYDPRSEHQICNRAFALHLRDYPRVEVLAAYEHAWQVINDPAKWEKLALIDLRAHGRTVRTDSPPVPDDLIEAVAALAKGAE